MASVKDGLLSKVTSAWHAIWRLKGSPAQDMTSFTPLPVIRDSDPDMTHPLFSEMVELAQLNDNEFEWRESARWVKFEEEVEEGGNRWSKPHVSSLSLHSLLELRNFLSNQSVILDKDPDSLHHLMDEVLNSFNGNLNEAAKLRLRNVLLAPIRHQHEIGSGVAKLPIIRSLADIGKIHSSSKSFTNQKTNNNPSGNDLGQFLHIPGSETTSGNISRSPSGANLGGANGDVQVSKGNTNFMKKIPPKAETCNILVGELDFVDKPLAAFIRLKNPMRLGNLTEVPVPTRFVFILLGPQGTRGRVREVGRVMATLMSDEIFNEVAYRAEKREHLLEGLDEFMEAVTVLPPGEWDSSIRIEPPAALPSQEARKRGDNDEPEVDEEEEEARMRDEAGLTRTGRLFGGLVNDIKRKKPWYFSDFRDGLSTQCLASWLFLYFACLTPIVTFGGLMGAATKGNMAAIESLVAGSMCGIVYGLFSGQPLTVLGSTGPVLVFETIIVQFCTSYDLYYLEFRVWIGIWVAIILFLLVAFDASAFVCYITRFTEENFATLIALIFMVEAVKNVANISNKYPINRNAEHESGYSCSCVPNDSYVGEINWTMVKFTECAKEPYYGELVGAGCSYFPDVFLLSVILFLGTFIISVMLKEFKLSSFFPTMIRQVISDFAVIIAIASMTGLDIYMGIRTPKLTVPAKFEPTLSPARTWFINPFGSNPIWSICLAPLPALLASILIFMDQQITSVIVNRKEHKLKKGGGFHLDLFVLSILILTCSFLGVPWFVAATTESLNHVNSLKMESESSAPGEKPSFLGVKEQRLTHLGIFIMVGLSVLMTPVLRFIPMPVLYGVFLYMGFNSIKGMEFFHRILLFLMPAKYQPDSMFLRKVPLMRVHLFTLIQLVFFIMLWVIKSVKQTSILFPLMLVVMILVRKGLNCVFTQRELKILDDIMPESTKRHREDMRKLSNVLVVDDLQKQMGSSDKLGRKKSIGLSEPTSIQIPLASGNVMRIPLNNMNMTEEVNNTGLWRKVQGNGEVGGEAQTPLLPGGGESGMPSIVGKRRRSSLSGGERRLSLYRTTDEDGGIMFKIEEAS